MQDGGIGGVNGSGSGAGGTTIYENGQNSPFSYQPSPQFAYLGVNNNVEDTGSWPATYRNVWIGNKPRPTTLGSALTPRGNEDERTALAERVLALSAVSPSPPAAAAAPDRAHARRRRRRLPR